MNLQNLDSKKTATKALKEHYGIKFNTTKLSLAETKQMLNKVRKLALESKQTKSFQNQQTNSSYMKLVFMEQALVDHYNELLNRPKPRIVLETSKVEESQVFLAAQDVVDTVQKMIVDTSDILVKELPALVQSIKSDIGANEGDQYNEKVTQALTQLQSALATSKSELESALGVITGEGGGMEFQDNDEQMPEVPDTGAPEEEMPAIGGEEEVDLDFEEPASMEMPGAGRPKR